MKKNKITTFKGYGRLTGGGEGRRSLGRREAGGRHAADGEGEEGRARHRLRRPHAARLHGRRHHPDQLRDSEDRRRCRSRWWSIGSGAVGVEFASIFKSFGAEVTILEMLPRVVPVEDEEISKELLRLFKKRGIDVNLSVKDTKIEKNKDGVLVSFTDANGKPQTKQAEKVLVAVGRAPRTYDIGLDKTNIKPDRGFIMTNEWMETTEPGVYAIGDIVGGLPQLAHVGSMAGLVVAAQAWRASTPSRSTATRIPGCTYTDPQIASVGLTEAQAKEKGFQVKVGKFPFVGNSKATILDAHDGFVKVVVGREVRRDSRRPHHRALCDGDHRRGVTALELEATVEEMMFTIHAHPTVAEALLDGFSSVEGMAVNV